MRGSRKKSGGSRIRGGRPAPRSKGVARRPSARTAVRRGANTRTSQVRQVKRQNTRRQASKTSARPRPVVRPRSNPIKRMPQARPKLARPGVSPKPATVSQSAGVRRTARMPRISGKPSRTVRPSARQIKRGGLAMPVVAAGTFIALNRARVHPDLLPEINYIETALSDLQVGSSFVDIQEDVAELDSNLNHALNLLESAREKGYKYQKDLEDIAYQAMSRWQKVSGDIGGKIDQQSRMIQNNFTNVNSGIQELNTVISTPSGASAVRRLQSEILNLKNDVQSVSNSIESIYSDIESQTSQLISRLTTIHWILTQQEEASFEFERDEDIYAAVTARWDQEGKDDPEGILFLSNKRLIFERKEKVSTKKILFVTTASELVQEAMVINKLSEIKEVKAHNKGLFGGKDFINVVYDDQTIPYQISHQDNKEWILLIKDAKSGKIEDDRTSGTGLSFSDLTGAVTEADILDAQNEVNELQDEMMLKNLQDEISTLEGEVNNLGRELAELRARGYNVEKTLEADIVVLAAQWEKIKNRTKTTISLQTNMLASQMKNIQEKMSALAAKSGNLALARPQFVSLKSAIASAEAQAEAAEETVLDQYDEYANEVEFLDSHFEWVDWMLDALETASFKLLATESGVAAVEAVWDRAGLEPENGVLFLTDQRFLWEDREGAYELKIDVPVSMIEKIVEDLDEETGSEKLVVSFGSDAPVSKGFFLLSQPVAEEWLQMVGRAQSDGYAQDMAIEIDEKDLERIKNAPTQCPNCGGAFTAPILRGQNEITCEFCGVVTRI
ncbi:MAG: hypothetical protein HON98_10645 [Chloroflexi bacterium]|jgi:hypothetical protein|nr:hypothetical protein [Chloroflexota bacterium]MBT3670679.1 hypothetical protein [Chloroflexota bacterium]MBT4002662.1 hypothetical protein [Chloroflexota bacterium]MBT4306285.1 hypothetical protein [Chloroflexota bacterium]MBT4532834.1 hypothetical protein [Chloroflexota bacterium]